MRSRSKADERIDFAYKILFARPAEAEEVVLAKKFLADADTLLREAGAPAPEIEAEAWRAYVRSLFRLNEFVYLD